LDAYDSSTVTLSGGTLGFGLSAWGSSTVIMRGGRLEVSLIAQDDSTVTMSGGTVGYNLVAYKYSTITVVGRHFEVDGVPVPYGDLTAQTGTLTGTLASGDPINSLFDRTDSSGEGHGTITLAYAPEPTQTLLCTAALTTLALLRRRVPSRRGTTCDRS